MPVAWIALGAAIVLEIIGTSALKLSAGFTRPAPTIVTLLCYAGAFYGLALALRVIPMGVAYAVWSGVGIVAISLIGLVFFRQGLDTGAIVGIALIVAGVVVLNLFSAAVPR